MKSNLLVLVLCLFIGIAQQKILRYAMRPYLKPTETNPVSMVHYLSYLHDGVHRFPLDAERYHVVFVIDLKLGKEGKEVEFMIDTGSAWMWVLTEDCETVLKEDCYNKKDRVTYSYLDGTVQGNVISTSVHIDDKVSNGHNMILVDTRTRLMSHRILGLTHTHDSRYPNFLETLKSNGLIDEIAFGVYQNPSNHKFELIVGGVDDSLVDINLVAKLIVNSDSMYSIMIYKVEFGGFALNGGNPYSSIIDTGNTLISLPMSWSDDFAKSLNSQGIKCKLYLESNSDFYQLGCMILDKSKFPSLIVTLAGKKITVPGHLLIDDCNTGISTFGSGEMCLMNIEFQQSGYEVILGKAFISNTYTTFFPDKRQIWVAPLSSVRASHANVIKPIVEQTARRRDMEEDMKLKLEAIYELAK